MPGGLTWGGSRKELVGLALVSQLNQHGFRMEVIKVAAVVRPDEFIRAVQRRLGECIHSDFLLGPSGPCKMQMSSLPWW